MESTSLHEVGSITLFAREQRNIKNAYSIFCSRESVRCAKRMAIGLVLSCLSSFADDRFLHETPNSFWESNLVATVIGYTGQRKFMGTVIPAMGPSDQYPREVWLYSMAPTNFAGTTFAIHQCGPWSLFSVYPTNQLFVFPASVCAKHVSTSVMLSGNYNAPIVPAPTITDYCPYRTFEKWFPVTDSQQRNWGISLNNELEAALNAAGKLRDEMIIEKDERSRSRLSNRVEHTERQIQSLRREIEDCKQQPQYFKTRIEWLKAQGVNLAPQTTSD